MFNVEYGNQVQINVSIFTILYVTLAELNGSHFSLDEGCLIDVLMHVDNES